MEGHCCSVVAAARVVIYIHPGSRLSACPRRPGYRPCCLRITGGIGPRQHPGTLGAWPAEVSGITRASAVLDRTSLGRHRGTASDVHEKGCLGISLQYKRITRP